MSTKATTAAVDEATAQLLEHPAFKCLVHQFARQVAARGLLNRTGLEEVTPELANAATYWAARLAVVGTGRPSLPADLRFAKAAIDLGWRSAPLLVAGRKKGNLVERQVPRAEPWQAALAVVFQTAVHRLLADGDLDRGMKAREAVPAVKRILEHLAETAVSLPAQFVAALQHLREPDAPNASRATLRERVLAAGKYLTSLTRAPSGAPTAVLVVFEETGGRGEGRRISGWTAAATFAKALGGSMPMRSRDVARPTKRR